MNFHLNIVDHVVDHDRDPSADVADDVDRRLLLGRQRRQRRSDWRHSILERRRRRRATVLVFILILERKKIRYRFTRLKIKGTGYLMFFPTKFLVDNTWFCEKFQGVALLWQSVSKIKILRGSCFIPLPHPDPSFLFWYANGWHKIHLKLIEIND